MSAGLLMVAPLLAWVYGVGAFSTWFVGVSLPAAAVLAVVGWWSARSPGHFDLHASLVLGTVGGVIGTAGYDIVRVPLAVAGMRVFAPIDSYGVLLLDARGSSPFTGFAGWSYHVTNGVGFGIAYAAVALGQRWWWAVVWAMALETAAVLTPFSSAYGIKGNWAAITVAYGAHLAYGAPLGKIVEQPSAWLVRLHEVGPHPALWALAAAAVLLFVWHRPGLAPTAPPSAPGTVNVVGGRFQPEWTRIAPGDCVTASERRFCFASPGVFRVKLSDAPYSGGFVIVDGGLGDSTQPAPETDLGSYGAPASRADPQSERLDQ